MSEPLRPPLADVNVLEIGTVIMAPFAGKILRDMGATVIKAEPPGGDIGRRIGLNNEAGMSALSLNLNAGKRSIELDAREPDGKSVLRELLAWADVVLTNLLPASRERLGIDWETVRQINPEAVLCTGQGFSSDSSLGDAPAYDDIVQAASGLSDTYRLRDGEPGYSPYVVADKVCGMMMANAALAALHDRTVSGAGTWVDVPMVDTMAGFTMVEHLGGASYLPQRGPVGWSRVLTPDHRPHRATDGWVCVMPYTDVNWRAFCELLDRPDLLSHPQLRTTALRSANAARYEEVIASYAAFRSCERIEEECRARRIPVQRVNQMDDLVDDPYLAGRPMLTRTTHPTEGEYVHVGSPVTFHGRERAPVRDLAPLDGDREEVLALLRRAARTEPA